MFISADGRFTTHTRRMRFSGPLTGVLCKRPFPEFVASETAVIGGHLSVM
jgi:hypothetical protein